MTEQFTPGPWKACASIEGDFFAVYPDTGRAEFPIAKKPEYIRDDVWRQNANLIAAAPDLYEALQRIQDEANTVCGDWRETASMIDSICIAALATARGEQSL